MLLSMSPRAHQSLGSGRRLLLLLALTETMAATSSSPLSFARPAAGLPRGVPGVMGAEEVFRAPALGLAAAHPDDGEDDGDDEGERAHQSAVPLGPEAVGVPGSATAWSTGTTIVGVVCPGGVVLAADTRATAGEIVADKHCEKLHRLAPNIFCGGAGTAADAEHAARAVACELAALRQAGRLASPSQFAQCWPAAPDTAAGWGAASVRAARHEQRLVTLRPRGRRLLAGAVPLDGTARMEAALRLVADRQCAERGSGGGCDAAFLLGGVDDAGGPSLLALGGGGSAEAVTTFAALGSGEQAAASVLEASWRPGLSLDEAVLLAVSAVQAGVENDLGSGGGVDVCILAEEEEEEEVVEEKAEDATEEVAGDTGAFVGSEGTAEASGAESLQRSGAGAPRRPLRRRRRRAWVRVWRGFRAEEGTQVRAGGDDRCRRGRGVEAGVEAAAEGAGSADLEGLPGYSQEERFRAREAAARRRLDRLTLRRTEAPAAGPGGDGAVLPCVGMMS